MKFCMGSKAPYKNCLTSGIRRHKMIHDLNGCYCANCGIHCGESPQLHHEDFFAGDKIVMTNAKFEAHKLVAPLAHSSGIGMFPCVNNAFHVR